MASDRSLREKFQNFKKKNAQEENALTGGINWARTNQRGKKMSKTQSISSRENLQGVPLNALLAQQKTPMKIMEPDLISLG